MVGHREGERRNRLENFCTKRFWENRAAKIFRIGSRVGREGGRSDVERGIP